MVKKWQNRHKNTKKRVRYWAFGPVFHFIPASAKNFYFGASLKSSGIKFYSLAINIYSSNQIVLYSSNQNESILTLVLLTTIHLKSICH